MFRKIPGEKKYRDKQREMDAAYEAENVSSFNAKERYNWYYEWSLQVAEARIEYDLYRTDYWREQARRYLVEVPYPNDDSDLWERQEITFQWVLTDKGVSTIRQAVRTEQLASQEIWFRRLIIVFGGATAIASISAAIITGAQMFSCP